MTQSPQVWQQGAQTLCCIERRQETADAVTLVFRPLQALAVSYQPGQFLLLTVEIDGQSHSRAYSLSSSPSRSADLAVTVKRVSGLFGQGRRRISRPNHRRVHHFRFCPSDCRRRLRD